MTWERREIIRPRRPAPTCRICGQHIPRGRRTLCSDLCARIADNRLGLWARTTPNTTGGRSGPEYRAAVAAVRHRAKQGEGCYFCGGAFDFTLPTNHRAAFTAHHLDRIVDGHPAVVDQSRMAPAHRGCNARDGLRAANAQRAARNARDRTTKTGGAKRQAYPQ